MRTADMRQMDVITKPKGKGHNIKVSFVLQTPEPVHINSPESALARILDSHGSDAHIIKGAVIALSKDVGAAVAAFSIARVPAKVMLLILSHASILSPMQRWHLLVAWHLDVTLPRSRLTPLRPIPHALVMTQTHDSVPFDMRSSIMRDLLASVDLLSLDPHDPIVEPHLHLLPENVRAAVGCLSMPAPQKPASTPATVIHALRLIDRALGQSTNWISALQCVEGENCLSYFRRAKDLVQKFVATSQSMAIIAVAEGGHVVGTLLSYQKEYGAMFHLGWDDRICIHEAKDLSRMPTYTFGDAITFGNDDFEITTLDGEIICCVAPGGNFIGCHNACELKWIHSRVHHFEIFVSTVKGG